VCSSDLAISGQTTNPNVSIDGLEPSSLNANLKYVTVEYSYTLPSTLPFNTPNAFTLKAPNSMQYDTSSIRQFILRDGTKAYIADINYLSGYDASITSPSRIKSLQPTDIPVGGVEVYSIPMAVELLIANHQRLGAINSIESQIEATINGGSYPFELLKDGTEPIYEEVTRNVDGIDVTYLRLFLKFSKLDKSGTNTIG